MVDPAIGSLLFTAVKGSYELIKEASALDLSKKSAVIDWNDSILEVEWHLQNYKGRTSFWLEVKLLISKIF